MVMPDNRHICRLRSSPIAWAHIPTLVAQNAYVHPRTIRDTLIDNLRARLVGAGFESPTALARKARVDPSYMSKLMRGQFSCTVDVLAKFAAALDCQPWELLVDSDATREAAYKKILREP